MNSSHILFYLRALNVYVLNCNDDKLWIASQNKMIYIWFDQTLLFYYPNWQPIFFVHNPLRNSETTCMEDGFMNW